MEEMNREQVPHCIESILAIYFQKNYLHVYMYLYVVTHILEQLVCQPIMKVNWLICLVTNTNWIVLKSDLQSDKADGGMQHASFRNGKR